MRKRNWFKTEVEYWAARLVLGGLGLLPRKLSIALGLFTARVGFHLLGALRRTGYINLSIAFPEMPESERSRLLKLSFENLGRVLGEVSKFPTASADSLSRLIDYDFDPAERAVYDAERAKGRGVIIASPHLGNWEMGVFAYSAIYEPVTYLARPLDNPKVESMIARIRSKFGNRAINKINSVRSAMALLGEGSIIGVLPDVNVQEKDGVFVPFFGTLACTTAGVALLAKRTNAMIVPICCVWDTSRQKYRAMHGKIIEPVSSDDRHRDLLETTAAMNAAMEDFVRRFPDQWLWIHKRWKTRPAGEPDLYSPNDPISRP